MYSVRSCGSRVQPCARCGLGGSEPIARTFKILRHRAAERLHLARPCQLDRAQQSSVRTQARPIRTRTTRRTKGGWTHASPKPYARRRLRSSTEPPSFRAPSAAFVKTGPSRVSGNRPIVPASGAATSAPGPRPLKPKLAASAPGLLLARTACRSRRLDVVDEEEAPVCSCP